MDNALFDEHMVEYENIRLEKQEGEYTGNFTFGVTAIPGRLLVSSRSRNKRTTAWIK